MNIKELWKKIEEICPSDLAEEWDNSGQQITLSEKEVKKVLVALEVTDAIIEEAISLNVEAIVTHHPLFFGSFNNITEDILPTKYSIKLIANGISVFSCHTNFDTMEGGNNDYFGSILGFKDIINHGIFRSGKTSDEISISDFIEYVSKELSIPKESIRLIGDLDQMVKNVAWCTGAGADYMMYAYDLGVDLYISGDIKYHDAMTAKEFGINVLDVGHFGSEKIFTPNMAGILRNSLPELEIIESKKDKDPFYAKETDHD